MTEPADGTFNLAGEGSTVGMQADQIWNSTVYQVLQEDPPERLYEVGVSYLEGGAPSEARRLIRQAIARNFDSGEVRFHWVLAMLSKRSYRDLSRDEHEQLARGFDRVHHYAEDDWKHALEALGQLLECLSNPDNDSELPLKKLQALPRPQLDAIERHLELVLTGGTKDSLWAGTRARIEASRLAKDRTERAWTYFHPNPARARVRQPIPNMTTAGDRFLAAASLGLFAVADGLLGWLVITHPHPLPILAWLVAIGAAGPAVRHGFERQHRAVRLHDKEREHAAQQRVDTGLEGGFAKKVDRSFDYYFAKYVPAETDRDAWLAATQGIRDTLRDEVVEIYREEGIGAEQVNWLIRYLVGEVKRQWQDGTLHDYRIRYRTPRSTTFWYWVSLTALVPAALLVAIAAVRANPLEGTVAAVLALLSGRSAVQRGWRIGSEKRRHAEDETEAELREKDREAAHDRWTAKLSVRPADEEMETWLYWDKTALLDETLRQFRLAWRDVIAYAFLLTRARNATRARQKNGPWRYKRYSLRLFLLTADGVRDVATDLDFEKGTFGPKMRDNYRFDAVSSVEVAESTNGSTLTLTLMNGPARTILAPKLGGSAPQDDEDPALLALVDLDTSELTHALHVLEGVAAEGTGWVERNLNPPGI